MRQRLTYANVMSSIAVFAALGGGAYAASKVGSDDIAKNAVKSKHVGKDALKGGDIKESTLKGTPPLAYAHVVDGAAVPGRSRGVTVIGDNVTGLYCLQVKGTARNVQLTGDDNSLDVIAIASLSRDLCPAGTEVEILTGNPDGAFLDRDFFVLIN